jgi:hypothetical protein
MDQRRNAQRVGAPASGLEGRRADEAAMGVYEAG